MCEGTCVFLLLLKENLVRQMFVRFKQTCKGFPLVFSVLNCVEDLLQEHDGEPAAHLHRLAHP